MTREEVGIVIHGIIEKAVSRRIARWEHVEEIFAAMGKLSPEPKPRKEVPPYDPALVRRIWERVKSTPELDRSAREILRQMGLL